MVFVFKNRAGHGRVGQLAGVGSVGIVHFHLNPVEAVKPLCGADPDKARGISIDAPVGALREALGEAQVVEIEVGRLAPAEQWEEQRKSPSCQVRQDGLGKLDEGGIARAKHGDCFSRARVGKIILTAHLDNKTAGMGGPMQPLCC